MFIIPVFLWLYILGGCGAMYTVFVEAEEFRGQRTIKQHRMVNEVLIYLRKYFLPEFHIFIVSL